MKHEKLLAASVLTAALAAVPAVAAAAQPNVYLGGGMGYFRLNDDFFLERDESFKDDRWAWKAHIGMQFNDVLSMEGGYVDFGSPRDGGLEMDVDGWQLSAMAHLPLAANFAPYGKIGVLFWDRKRNAAFGSASDSDEDMFYGVGARFDLSHAVQLRLEYDRYAVDDSDIDMGTVSLQYRF